MKKLQHDKSLANKGFTLVELLVSITILAFIMIAVGGVMYSNNIIFKKTKSDIYVQNNAQDVYNKINEDLMQAKHVYIEGYVLDNPDGTKNDNGVYFKTNEPGIATTESLTFKKFILPTDKYVVSHASGSIKDFIAGNLERENTSRQTMLNAMSPTERAFYESLLSITNEVTLETTLQGLTQAERDTYVSLKYYNESEVEQYRESLNDADRAEFDLYRNRFRYMDEIEQTECADFLNSISGISSAESFDSLKHTYTEASTGKEKYSYDLVYITTLKLELSQKVDTSNCTSTATYNADKTRFADNNLKDSVTVTYTFSQGTDGQNQIKVDYNYKYMDKLNTTTYVGIDNNVVTRKLNYATGSTGIIPGCEAMIDAENDSIKLNLYFSENSMSYTDRGMVKLRNSYVLHDAK